jgi:seryl-tRNA synthetase
MLDTKWLCDNVEAVRGVLKNRNTEAPLDKIVALNDERKKLQFEFDRLRAEQNTRSKEIAVCKKENRDASSILHAMQTLSKEVKDIGQKQSGIEEQLKQAALWIPNMPHVSVPIGADEKSNQEIKSWGKRPAFDFKPKEHWELGENLGLLDFERGAKVAGARFTFYRGELARLERSLIAFMIDIHSKEHGYEEIMPPYLVNMASMTGTNQLPKFEEDAFKTSDGYYLIPTAEVPVTNFHRDEILDEKMLPVKFCAYSACFRSEAGSYGKDVKGLIRQHQFNKVELVKITRPEDSYAEHVALTRDAEKILERLNLPYRTVLLCTGDMGFGSAKTFDIEVWLPGQNTYREISSCSNFEAFQARRMNLRFRRADKKVEHAHTLNGSGLAVGRTLVAILENYQQVDGSILVPEALRSYMGTDKICGRD